MLKFGMTILCQIHGVEDSRTIFIKKIKERGGF